MDCINYFSFVCWFVDEMMNLDFVAPLTFHLAPFDIFFSFELIILTTGCSGRTFSFSSSVWDLLDVACLFNFFTDIQYSRKINSTLVIPWPVPTSGQNFNLPRTFIYDQIHSKLRPFPSAICSHKMRGVTIM